MPKMDGAARIAVERKRQIEVEGFSLEHDQFWNYGELAAAAVCYAMPGNMRQCLKKKLGDAFDHLWPFDPRLWKPSHGNTVRDLEKAGALIAAEIDRRLAAAEEEKKEDYDA